MKQNQTDTAERVISRLFVLYRGARGLMGRRKEERISPFFVPSHQPPRLAQFKNKREDWSRVSRYGYAKLVIDTQRKHEQCESISNSRVTVEFIFHAHSRAGYVKLF